MKRVAKLGILWAHESGATAIEYGMIASLIGLSLFAILDILGSAVAEVFLKVSTRV